MYNCDICGAVHSGKQIKRVSEIRNVVYDIFLMKGHGRGGLERKPYYYKNSNGWEIVEEEVLCGECAEKYKDLQPRVKREEKVIECLGTKPKESEEDNKKSSRKNEDVSEVEREKYE